MFNRENRVLRETLELVRAQRDLIVTELRKELNEKDAEIAALRAGGSDASV